MESRKIFVAIISGFMDEELESMRLFSKMEENGLGFRYNRRTFIFPADSIISARKIIEDVVKVSWDGTRELNGVCLFEATEDLVRETNMGALYLAKVRAMAGEKL